MFYDFAAIARISVADLCPSAARELGAGLVNAPLWLWARWITNSLGIHMSYETWTQLRLATFSSLINGGALHSSDERRSTELMIVTRR